MPEQDKNKTNLQQRVSLRIVLPKIILLQSDIKTLKIMFPDAKNDWAKKAKNKAKNKTNLLQYISLHIALPQIIPLLNDAKALNIMFPATQNDQAKNARKKPKTKHYNFIKQH